MRAICRWLTILVSLHMASVAAADGDPKRGAQIYRACVACHALEPGLHLSGPSLGNVLGRAVGKAAGYMRYSPGLKEAAYWEKNIRLKIDSIGTGPASGVAVLLGAGMRGDRFSVIFSSLADLTSIIQEKC